MKTRKFRVEFLREFTDNETYVAMINQKWDHEAAKEDCEVVFRSKDDGKHYSFPYYSNVDVGVDSFEIAEDDEEVTCHRVEAREITTTTWERV